MNSRFSTGAAYGTGVATLIAGITLNEWAAIAGIVGVVGTMAITLHYKHKDELRAEEAAARAKEIDDLEMATRRAKLDLLHIELASREESRR
jgi:hypothetical protein